MKRNARTLKASEKSKMRIGVTFRHGSGVGVTDGVGLGIVTEVLCNKKCCDI